MLVATKRSYIITGIIIILFWGLVAAVAYNRISTSFTTKAYCNDYGCTNFRDGSNWAIRNCQGATTTEGSTYTCSQKGNTGSCGTTTYCCPGSGMLWTADMTSCSQTQASSDCCACPTPTPSMIQSQCNGPCMGNGNCTSGSICVFDQGYGWVCRNPACYKTTGCNCTAVSLTPTSTPTPTPIQVKYYCGEPCLSTSECQSDLRCVYMNNTKECRNPDCPEKNTCLCIQ